MHRKLNSGGDSANLDEVLADYMRRVDRGEAIDREELIAAHPELAAELREYFSQAQAIERLADGATADFAHHATPRSGLEVRCPSCHAPMEVAVDTALTDLTCSSCGSHFSLVDQSKATRLAPSLTKLGRFELIERLGIGGFGSVWKARDNELDRTVAIKIPRAGAITGEDQEKFFREARAAAQLRHANIVSVHEVGRDGESVYIVSDFVRGVTLGDWITGQQLTSREAAELCAKIADALHHAHEKGVVHRDLKPANIMMDFDGQPHLMDFGLARRETGEITVTMDGQVLGTPAYMSPEQAEGEGHKADRRSDVYSLGVILFQLVTGELPFRGNARMLIKQVIQDEPPSPRKLNSNVPKDLETISLKCLEKEPARRYQTANEVAAEFHRYLDGEPLHARPIGRVARLWRWAKRRPTAAALMAVLTGVAVVGPIIAAQQAILRVQRDRLLADVAEQQKALRSTFTQLAKNNDQLQSQLAHNLIERGVAECKAGSVPQGVALFAAAYDAAGPDQSLRKSARNLIAGWSANMGTPLLHDGRVSFVTFSPDDRLILTSSQDKTVRQWDANTGNPQGPVITVSSWVRSAAFSPDGRTILTGCVDGTAQLWSAETGSPLGESMVHEGDVRSVAISPDGRTALTGSEDSTVRFWDANTGKSLREPLKPGSPVYAIAFSPDGTTFVTGMGNGTAQLWDTHTGKQLGEPLQHRALVWAVAFSPDGSTLATGSWDGSACLWDAKTQKQIGVQMAHSSSVDSLAFSPDGATLLSGSYDHTARLWDARTGEDKSDPLRHDLGVTSVAFSHDGRKFLTGAWDNTVWLWDTDSHRLLAFGSNRSSRSCTELSHDAILTGAVFMPDSRRAVTADLDGTVRIWDIATGKSLGEPLRTGSALSAIAVSPNGSTLMTGSRDSTAQLWNLSDREPLGESMHNDGIVNSVDFSADGKTVLTVSSRDQSIRFWNAETGKSQGSPVRNPRTDILNATFFPTGRNVAIATYGRVTVFDPTTGKMRGAMGHNENVYGVAFSRDGKTLLTACEDHTARFWNVRTGKTFGAPLRSEDVVNACDLSSDGHIAVTGGRDSNAQLWDVHTRKPLGEPMRHDSSVTAVAISPDGRWVLTTCSGDQTARLWPVPALPDDTTELVKWAKGQTGFAVDPDGLVSRISRAEWRVARNWQQSQYLQPSISVLRQSVGERTTVELKVAAVGTFSGVVFLNSMAGYRDPDCFTVDVFQLDMGGLKSSAISRISDLVGYRIRATGKVVEGRNNRLRMSIPASQLEILAPNGQWIRPSLLEQKDLAAESVDPPVLKLRTLLGTEQTVEFRVQSVGGRFFGIFINSKSDYNDPDCVTAFIAADQVPALSALGLSEPTQDLPGKKIQVTGKIEEKADRGGQIWIRITYPAAQLKLLP